MRKANMSQQKILNDLIVRYPKLSECRESIWSAYELMEESFAYGGKLLAAGNGGSAADSEHIVGELMKGFVKHRYLDDDMKGKIMRINAKFGEALCKNLQKALPAIALTGHNALSTAYLNDVDGTMVFAQQVLGYGGDKDVFLGITTSGNSQNVLNAMIVAQAKGLKTIALTGNMGGEIKTIADISVIVPETATYKIQELHLPIYHAWCLMLEDKFFEI